VARIQVDPTKIEVILALPKPCTQTKVRSFIGYAGYFRIFIENFSKIAAPLYVLSGNVEFNWSHKCDIAFADLKKMISTVLVLQGPN